MKKIFLLMGIFSTPAWAVNELPYFAIGAKGGYQWSLDEDYHHSNPEGAIFGVYSGLQFAPSWRWDVGYQFHDELTAGATSINVKTWLVESALRYDWYLQDNLSLYGRLGAAYWNMEKTLYSSYKGDATGFSPLGEVGVNYSVNPSVQLSVGYQYIDSIGKSNTGNYDSHGLLVSLTYTFGRVAQPALAKMAPALPNEGIPVAVKGDAPNSQPHILALPSKTTVALLFDFDSAEFSDGLVEQLTEVAQVLTTYPQAQAVVVGYTDSVGSAAYNQKLSEHRAQTVTNALIELGVLPTQLDWRGEGESQAIADNKTAGGRAKNRRVEITIPDFQFQK